MDVKEYEKIKKDIEDMKSEKAKLQGQLQVAEETKAKLMADLKAEGIDSFDELDKKIEFLQKEIAEEGDKIKKELVEAKSKLTEISKQLQSI